MGEYADMMLDGTCCAGCGEYLGDGEGFPVYCAGCGGFTDDFEVPDWMAPAFDCPRCNRVFGSEHALRQHYAAKHPEKTHGCSDCGKKFATDSALGDHIKAKHCPPAEQEQ